jgi:hypothetical protein
MSRFEVVGPTLFVADKQCTCLEESGDKHYVIVYAVDICYRILLYGALSVNEAATLAREHRKVTPSPVCGEPYLEASPLTYPLRQRWL